MAHLAPCVRALPAPARERLRCEAILAVADEPLPVAPTVLVLFASAA